MGGPVPYLTWNDPHIGGLTTFSSFVKCSQPPWISETWPSLLRWASNILDMSTPKQHKHPAVSLAVTAFIEFFFGSLLELLQNKHPAVSLAVTALMEFYFLFSA